MKIYRMLALTAVMALVASQAGATTILINHTAGAASPGNGALFSDPTGDDAAIAVGVFGGSVDSTNASGRALDGSGPNQNVPNPVSSLAGILDNQGVQIPGFTSYRGRYSGGNSAFGLLENGGRLGKANADHDGQGFANTGQFFLVSDEYSPGAFTSITWSVLAGSDDGDTDINAYLFVDGVGSLAGSMANVGSGGTTVGATNAIAGSTVRLVIEANDGEAAGGSAERARSLLDDVFLSVELVPEPSSMMMAGLALAGVFASRRRS